jgi:hypothetical protein
MLPVGRTASNHHAGGPRYERHKSHIPDAIKSVLERVAEYLGTRDAQ